MNRTVIVARVGAKDDHPIPMPALERYDGPAFRGIRKTMWEGHWSKDVQLLIVSVEFGLITANSSIPWYDRTLRVTPARAAELNTEIADALDQHLADADRLFLNVAGAYSMALAGSPALTNLRQDSRVQEAADRNGERLAQLKQWIQSHEENAA